MNSTVIFSGADYPLRPDERDQEIAEEREREFNAEPGPRVGDFVLMPNGKLERFSHHFGNALQSSEGGSFYMGKRYVSFSGGLNPPIPIERLAETNQKKPGRFWFFHRGWAKAHSAVYFSIDCKVYQFINNTREGEHHG